MPGFLLHLGATVMCSHAGQATPTGAESSCARQRPADCGADQHVRVAGCTLPPPTAGNGPCVTAQYTTSATRVSSNGVPLLLIDSQAICAPTGTPLIASVTQTRVSGI